MPSWRISAMSGGQSKTGAALVPVPARDAGGWQARGLISGSPGTRPIAAPRPGGVPQDRTGQAGSGYHRSSDAPSFFRPGVYYLCGPQVHAPVSILSDNQMPVPAVNPLLLPAVVMPGPVMQGMYQVQQPKVAPRYPNLKNRGRRG